MLDRILDAFRPDEIPGGISVVDFGAKRDGQTDDTDAFNAAIASAAKSGGVVYVPAGHYRIRYSDPRVQFTGVTLRDGCQLIGDGADQTILQGLAETMDPDGKTFRLILVESNTRTANLTVDGDGDGLKAIRQRFNGSKRTSLLRSIPGSSGVVFEDLVIRNGYSHRTEGFGLSVGNTHDCVVRRVEAYGQLGGSGISVDGNAWKRSRPTNVRVEDVDCHHNTWQGVTIYGSKDITVVRARSYENDRHGLNCEWSENVTFEDCESWSNGRRGLRVTGRSRHVRFVNVDSKDNGAEYPEGAELMLGLQIFPKANPRTGEKEMDFPDDVEVIGGSLNPATGKPLVVMDIGSEDQGELKRYESRLRIDPATANDVTMRPVDAAGKLRRTAREQDEDSGPDDASDDEA